jgi:iron complex outermembrane receptor protein
MGAEYDSGRGRGACRTGFTKPDFLDSVSRLALLLGCTVPGLAQAQSPVATTNAPSPTASVKVGSSAGIEQVVVTARRRSEALSKTAVAVTALGTAQLREHSITKETDLQAAVSGLTVKTTGSQNQLNYALRGQTLDSFSGSSPGVLPYLNDVFIDSETATSFYDLASVQVLKGPQGTLFGRNTTGGAVLYNTAQPSDTYGGFLDISVGNYAYNEYKGAVDIPISPGKVELRIAGDVTEGNGYVKDLTSGGTLGDSDSKSGRATLKVTPFDGLTSTTVVQYGSYGGTELIGGLYDYYGIGQTNNGYALNDTAALLYPGPKGIAAELAAQRLNGPYNEALAYQPTHYSRNIFLENTTSYEMNPNLTFKNIASYSNSTTRSDQPLSGAPLGVLDLLNIPSTSGDGIHYQVDQWSEEFQILGKAFDNHLNYIAGLYLSSDMNHQDIPVVVGLSLPTGPLEFFHHDGINVDQSQAVYAQATYHFLDWVPGLSFTIGGRETWEYLLLSQGPNSNVPYADQNTHEANPSWQFGLEYQATSNLLVYVLNRGSWRAGNFNSTTTPVDNQNEFRPEFAHDYELGAKFSGQVYGKPAFFNVAIYDELVSDVQRDIYFQVDGAPSSLTDNVPKAVIKGVEIDGELRPVNWLLLGGNGSYTSAVYTNGTVNVLGTSLSFGDYQDTPKWTGSFFAQFTLPSPEPWGNMTFRSDIYYQTTQYFSSLASSISPGVKLPEYALLNLRYDWRQMFGKNISLGLFAKNLLDRRYYEGGFALGPDVGFNTALPGAPRTYGAELNYTF